ncbi:uncharacterized protein LOC123540960 [Mercenaria mercenaria]|uniref:uncharacterized protein LOC123540960 n=1 Tax=Mercenaria mercenaria TaxID=6596 RepID=UPI00234E4B3B|nr:uncharacterized protein LOC123540960 [Mercenaria mercenaria]
MSNTDDRDLSLLICSTLNNFGFKKENVRFRSKCVMSDEVMKNNNVRKKLGSPHAYIISVGSAGEGVKLSDSDFDRMFVRDDIICLDKGDTVENLTILEADNSNTAPGYTKVVLTNTLVRSYAGMKLHLSTCGYATSTGGHSYLSSAKYRSLNFNSYKTFTQNDALTESVTTNGPAVTVKMSDNLTNFEGDVVYSLFFYGSEHLRTWANRTRYYTWPSSECVREISGMEGYLVPVGDKQSAQQDLEWRICYTTAEKELIASLNDIQIKVYVLLKMVAKSVLKPVCKALTSYVVKNVVFWIMEGTDQQILSPDIIVNLIQKSLYFIKYCLENNHFPNYMIPERNLLRGAVNSMEKQNVLNFLSDCLREGGTVLLRVPKLYRCVSYSMTYPENVIKYGKWRDEVEKQMYLLELRKYEITDPISSISNLSEWENLISTVNNDARLEGPKIEMFSLVVPDAIPLFISGKEV